MERIRRMIDELDLLTRTPEQIELHQAIIEAMFAQADAVQRQIAGTAEPEDMIVVVRNPRDARNYALAYALLVHVLGGHEAG